MKPARIFTALLVQETLDAMAIHDRTEEYGDCLIWTGATGNRAHSGLGGLHFC